MSNLFTNSILQGDCREVMKTLPKDTRSAWHKLQIETRFLFRILKKSA